MRVPDERIDQLRLTRRERVVFSDRKSFDASIGVDAKANEMFEPGMTEHGERLLVFDPENGNEG